MAGSKKKPVNSTGVDDILDDEELEIETPDLMALFGRNIEAEESGVWVAVPNSRTGEPTDIGVFIRSAANSTAGRKHRKLTDKKTKEHTRTHNGAKPNDDDIRRITVESMIEAGLLTNWRNVYIGKREIPFTEALEILSDKRYVDFYLAIVALIIDAESFKNGETEKN